MDGQCAKKCKGLGPYHEPVQSMFPLAQVITLNHSDIIIIGQTGRKAES